MGVHTAVETNGHYGDKLSDAELEAIDLVLLDIKMWDRERHLRLTGMPPDQTRAFAKRLAANGRPMWVRFVLVPQLTDDAGNISRIASFAASLGNVARVEVLPFHQLGSFKWLKLGRASRRPVQSRGLDCVLMLRGASVSVAARCY
jgi:pyruvate formate lyase activating enzyme